MHNISKNQPRVSTPSALNRLALAEARKGRGFSARRWVATPSSENDYKGVYEDWTAEVLAMPRKSEMRFVKYNGSKMTAGTANELRRADRAPGERTKAGMEHDARRALAYMAQMTGKQFDGVEWGVCANGLKRVQFVTISAKVEREWDSKKRRYVETPSAPAEKVEIPHWDWNGHNDTVSACADAAMI